MKQIVWKITNVFQDLMGLKQKRINRLGIHWQNKKNRQSVNRNRYSMAWDGATICFVFHWLMCDFSRAGWKWARKCYEVETNGSFRIYDLNIDVALGAFCIRLSREQPYSVLRKGWQTGENFVRKIGCSFILSQWVKKYLVTEGNFTTENIFGWTW